MKTYKYSRKKLIKKYDYDMEYTILDFEKDLLAKQDKPFECKDSIGFPVENPLQDKPVCEHKDWNVYKEKEVWRKVCHICHKDTIVEEFDKSPIEDTNKTSLEVPTKFDECKCICHSDKPCLSPHNQENCLCKSTNQQELKLPEKIARVDIVKYPIPELARFDKLAGAINELIDYLTLISKNHSK